MLEESRAVVVCNRCNQGLPYKSIIKGAEAGKISYSLYCRICPNKVGIKYNVDNSPKVHAKRQREIYKLWDSENQASEPKLAIVEPIDDYIKSVDECIDICREKKFKNIVIIGLGDDGGVSRVDCDKNMNNEAVLYALWQALKLY